MNNKKILIVGNLYALAKKISTMVDKVYMTSCNSLLQDVISVDIRENNPEELLQFAIENDIDLTIVTSDNAIKTDIANVFQNNKKLIFAPCANSAELAWDKAYGKRFAYKMHMPIARFGVFDKPAIALEHLSSYNFPIIINNEYQERVCCTTKEQAKYYIQNYFDFGTKKITTEEYIYGHKFSYYAITDGYLALPLTTVANYEFSDDGDGGSLTDGMGCYLPDYNISEDICKDLLNNINDILIQLQKNETPYCGIIGIDAVICENSYKITGFKTFFNDIDAQAILNSIDENIVELFEACANGSFSDEYEEILINDNFSVSALVKSRNQDSVVPNIKLVESELSFLNMFRNKYFEYISGKDKSFVITACAKTLSRARKNMYEDLELIKFNGMKYRKDI